MNGVKVKQKEYVIIFKKLFIVTMVNLNDDRLINKRE